MNAKQAAIGAAGALFVYVGYKQFTRAADIDLLARTIFGEARGETIEGRIAVANVVMNRVTDPRWPDTVRGVVLQPKQFSTWNENDHNRDLILAVTDENPVFRECLEIAQAAVDGRLDDMTGGANHYFADWIDLPSWARRMASTVTIGAHRFLIG
jgi:spore germination cell wall hydrolase CwlJ-like protein